MKFTRQLGLTRRKIWGKVFFPTYFYDIPKYINPILIRGVDYAHCMKFSPLDFKMFRWICQGREQPYLLSEVILILGIVAQCKLLHNVSFINFNWLTLPRTLKMSRYTALNIDFNRNSSVAFGNLMAGTSVYVSNSLSYLHASIASLHNRANEPTATQTSQATLDATTLLSTLDFYKHTFVKFGIPRSSLAVGQLSPGLIRLFRISSFINKIFYQPWGLFQYYLY